VATFYHGTTLKAGEAILKQGFNMSLSGARQKALHGKDVAEVRGVYVTTDQRRAEWYAGGLKTPGAGGGAVIEAKASGRMMPERDWWRLKAAVSKELGADALYSPKRQEAIDETIQRAKKLGFVGFHEMQDEYVVFSPRDLKVTGGYSMQAWGREPLTAASRVAARWRATNF